jgi:hypothetical protein
MPKPKTAELDELKKIAQDRIGELKLHYAPEVRAGNFSQKRVDQAAEYAFNIWLTAAAENYESGILQLGAAKIGNEWSFDTVTSTSIGRYFQRKLPQPK